MWWCGRPLPLIPCPGAGSRLNPAGVCAFGKWVFPFPGNDDSIAKPFLVPSLRDEPEAPLLGDTSGFPLHSQTLGMFF